MRIIHAADFHLDAPFAALPERRAAERREEQRALPDRLADLAEDQGAELVLLSGDLLDGEETYYETTQTLARALGRIRAQVFIAPGNHDFWSTRSPYAGVAWPKNVHIFTRGEVETVDLPALNCTVHGAAFTAPYADVSPLRDIQIPDDGRIHLMVVHGDVDGTGRYGSIPTDEIAVSGLDYLALGHIHACSGVKRAGNTFWAYPGCPEGRGFDELGDKGVLCGTVDKGAADLKFVSLCRRRYEIKTVDSSDQDPGEALRKALPPVPSANICRILITGETGIAGLDLAALEELAAPWYYSVTLRDQTRVRRDLWSRAGEDTLTGIFLREMQMQVETAEDERARALAEKAVRFGLAALENREDCCP